MQAVFQAALPLPLQTVNWYVKEYQYFLAWVNNAYDGMITSIPIHKLIDAYLVRLNELGCDSRAVDIVKTALYGYCELNNQHPKEFPLTPYRSAKTRPRGG